MDGVSLQESLSEVDPSLFQEFRSKFSNIKCDSLNKDAYVARWLKARNWDVEKAEKMYRNHLKWKEETNIDQILTSFTIPEVINKYFPGGMCGQDKFGRPAYICPAGTTDVFGLMKSASRSQLINSRYFLMETVIQDLLPAQTAKLGKPVDQVVIIFDLQHMNRRQLWRPWLNFVQELTGLFDVNYPELMSVCFVLNAPSFFSLVFSLLKPLLSKETQDKIRILGSNYHDELLKLFDPEHLPAHYGGTMTDPDGDPKCPSRICWGGIVPESFYISRPTDAALSTDDAAPSVDDSYLLVPIGRGSKESFCVGEVKSGDLITWEFFTEANDIAFSLWVDPVIDSPPSGSRKGNGFDVWLKNGMLNKLNSQKPYESNDPLVNSKSSTTLSTSFSLGSALSSLGGSSGSKSWRQVMPSTRVDCDLVPEGGQKKIEVSGTYYLSFDNTYSWTRAKRVWCRAEIQSPDGTILKKGPTTNFQTSILEQVSGDKPTNGFHYEDEDEVKEVEIGISEVLKEVNRSSHQTMSGSNLDIDLAALTMVLLRTLPLIRRRYRSKPDSFKAIN